MSTVLKTPSALKLAAYTISSASMAASIIRSTTSLGFAYQKSFVPPCSLVLIGGGARTQVLHRVDMNQAVDPNGDPVIFPHAEYNFVNYLPLNAIDRSDSDDERVVCKLPLNVIHVGLDITSRHIRKHAEELLAAHECTAGCEDSYAILTPRDPNASGLVDVESSEDSHTSRPKCIRSGRRRELRVSVTPAPIGYKVKRILRSRQTELLADEIALPDLPLPILSHRLSVQGLRSLALHHNIRIPARCPKPRCKELIQKHECHGCEPLLFIIIPVQTPTKTPKCKEDRPWIDTDLSPLLWDSSLCMPTEEYPPRPTTMVDIARAMRAYCAELTPQAIEECGCCVCGQLTKRVLLIPFNEGAYDLTILEEIGCTRKERTSSRDPIADIPGPVLDATLSDICPDCHDALKKGRRPKYALANRLWVGKVPSCLQDLTLGEAAMVSRVRYNRCVVRVAKGHLKMTSNVIAFEHPSKKIYDRLPMDRDELSEVLSVMYTGAEPPGDDDLKRTPVLVRRNKVRAALEWLKLNHKDYADLSIAYDTLDTYPLDDVPIGLLKQTTIIDGGNVLAAAKSVFDTDEDQGTEHGPCPFTVSALTSERHTTMTPTQRKVAAVQYLKNGGRSLAIGHDVSPQSLWNNPALYPQMFPWLFPYGLGGVGQDEHMNAISRPNHVIWLLMYHDKRYQTAASPLMVFFNHSLIQQSSGGSFITMKRNNFGRAADAIQKLDGSLLLAISERTKNGGRFIPQTPEEQRCATLLDQVEVVGNHVDGSLAKKKYQRGQIWSLIHYLNAPAWFITVSPADSKHPLCVHWASRDIEFKPEIKASKERLLLISSNPVACTRFFDHLIKLFIKHICGWTEDGPKRGLFGTPSAYYGTVEEQGRKTLHGHFLLWVAGQLPLHVVRERLMSGDSQFLRELTDYVESAFIGEFMTGSKDEVSTRVPQTTEYDDRGIHTILVDKSAVPDGYCDPTLTLPEAPPSEFCENPDVCRCENCLSLLSWWERFKLTVDDILIRSNVHSCYQKRVAKDTAPPGSTEGPKEAKVARVHFTGKGCLNKDGVCTARFPREVFMATTVDRETGHLNIKKQESSINDVCPTVTATNRCNTDARCLLSGTAVKAVVGYVTDYITKGYLKTHQIFAAMYESFSKNEGVLDPSNEQKPGNGARRMLTKIVNSLSAKMEIGAPMAALYLLKNPDHYTSHEFIPFYWKNYLNYVEGQWKALLDIAEPGDGDADLQPEDVGIARTGEITGDVSIEETSEAVLSELGVPLTYDESGNVLSIKIEDTDDDTIVLEGERHDEGSKIDVKMEDTALGNVDPEGIMFEDAPGHSETVQMSRMDGCFLAKTNTDDYRFRPVQHEGICLYDFIQCHVKHPIRSQRQPRKDLRWFHLLEYHPQHTTHALALDPGRRLLYVPHFIGPSLPRRDTGNREDYCCAMLTLFCPWRTGIDLKSANDTWEETFNKYEFTDQQKTLMENFNMRYKCYDARDDYGAIVKGATGSEGADDNDDEGDDTYADNGENPEDDDEELEMGFGKAASSLQRSNAAITLALKAAGWKAMSAIHTFTTGASKLPKIAIDSSLRSGAWNNIIKVEKLRAWRRKMSGFLRPGENETGGKDAREVINDAYVVPSSYLSKDFKPLEEKWSDAMLRVIKDFNLNEGQEKAFRIIANHSCTIAPDQLLMHLGGMGGTGKSTVIRALCQFFNDRDEQYRFVLLGPTGTSAALIGGSTYHTFLGVNQ
ncbi:hypothetical protein D9611_013146 [Ephemerocybe angulata]|uniref:ATP-dependent DNA helicase n=1 Tax=Ephemerocybe angulata TaxID=980116 RepID=A0A8H5BX56_9AGAR|nr:hypothetical protein D9611_013146 [Tulosesus angulatus]